MVEWTRGRQLRHSEGGRGDLSSSNAQRRAGCESVWIFISIPRGPGSWNFNDVTYHLSSYISMYPSAGSDARTGTRAHAHDAKMLSRRSSSALHVPSPLSTKRDVPRAARRHWPSEAAPVTVAAAVTMRNNHLPRLGIPELLRAREEKRFGRKVVIPQAVPRRITVPAEERGEWWRLTMEHYPLEGIPIHPMVPTMRCGLAGKLTSLFVRTVRIWEFMARTTRHGG